MDRKLMSSAVAAAVLGMLGGCVEQQNLAGDPAAEGYAAATADDLFVVDCLLPGQVRQLGSRLTYVGARRPVQTSAYDCQIRGGEYVAYDRASYGSALRVWLPLAEEGDAEAQNKLGEIYERGLAGPPDYAQAVYWYRRAADQGMERAQINLGFMYEKGLGVERDLGQALAWYRKSTELPDAVLIERSEYEAQQAQLNKLRQDLQRSREALDAARRQLRRSEQRLQRDHIDAPAAGVPDAAAREALEQQRLTLAQQRATISRLESDFRRQREQLLLIEAEGKSLEAQLELVRGQLEQTRLDSAHYEALARANERQLADTRAQLALLESQASARDQAALDQVRQLQEGLAAREQALAAQRSEVARLERLAQDLRRDAAQSRDELAAGIEVTLPKLQAQIDEARTLAAQRERALAETRSELERKQDALGAADRRLAELQDELQRREQQLGDQRERLAQLELESSQWQQKILQLEQKAAVAADRTSRTPSSPMPTTSEVPSPGPSIQLIEPPLVAARGDGDIVVPVKRSERVRSLIGQVKAPAGLYALTVNGTRTAVNDAGLFEADIAVTGARTPVSINAVDKLGNRGGLNFSLVAAEAAGTTIVAEVRNPLADVDTGKYYALVIGNRDYRDLPDLDTSINDATRVAAVLRERFGFEVSLLKDANRYRILSSLNDLRKKLTEKDNLLIYYAGHGELDRVNLRGHWLPVDAERNSTANWISNVAITDILNAMAARHVLLVADSCYSGALTRSSLSNLEAGQTEDARLHWLKTIAKMRSRTVLTSGGLAPVLDGGGGSHSVFAKAFLDVLENTNTIAEGQRIYREVSARVAFEANQFQVEQVPEYAPIKYAGHESGDFLFIPKI